LGFGFSVLIRKYCVTSAQRVAAVAFLSGLLLVGPTVSRPPDLPFSVWGATAPVPTLYGLAEALGREIPSGSRVFHLGSFQALYIAGLAPYLSQVFGAWTLSPISDARIRMKSGLWGKGEIRHWLEEDAEYAVVVPTTLPTYRAACGPCVDLALGLL